MQTYEPARAAILARLPDIGPHRAYQLAKILRRSGAVVPIGRRLYAIPHRLDEELAKGLDTHDASEPHAAP
jgi:hypothetical protein